jgi:L-alanine-DL-glutamate epimerase-like enolase superfamily enzyme
MRITDVKCHVLIDPDRDVSATSSAQDTIVVEICTDEDVSGFGETDLNPWVAKACIEAPGSHTIARGLREMLLGENPLAVEEIWDKLYVGSAMTGRRGAGINAIGAIDIALHDLRGKLLGRSCSELLDGPIKEQVIPYASLQPDVGDVDGYHEQTVADLVSCRGRGFRAAKIALTLDGPYAHKGLKASWARTTEILAAARAAVGPEFVLMVDLQYAFSDPQECLEVLAEWQRYDPYFVETPLWVDDLAGYALLAREQPIPIAMGELLTTRHEFKALIDEGLIAVAQPDIGRVGGLTEARRVADYAAVRGRLVTPHVWKTGLSIAAAVHFGAVTEICPFVEFLPADLCDSAIRRELTPDFALTEDGTIEVPAEPGLGVEINPDALERFRATSEALRLADAV